MLDGIEQVGNKVPHPAIIFLGLFVLVIVLSASSPRSTCRSPTRSPTPPPVASSRTYVGGTDVPDSSTRAEDYDDHDVEIVTRRPPRSRACSTRDGIRFLFTSFVSNFAGFGVVAVDPRGDDRRRRRRGGRA